MNYRNGIKRGFLGGAAVGLGFALVELFLFSAKSKGSVLLVIRALCYPASWIAAQLVDLIYSHNRIGPSRSEVVVFDALLCLLAALTWGIVGVCLVAIFPPKNDGLTRSPGPSR
jgi:RsiW-degrading membrane proteinase PrsW (M82 family)